MEMIMYMLIGFLFGLWWGYKKAMLDAEYFAAQSKKTPKDERTY
jgi:F0F1-type ATP synthase assembly protein I